MLADEGKATTSTIYIWSNTRCSTLSGTPHCCGGHFLPLASTPATRTVCVMLAPWLRYERCEEDDQHAPTSVRASPGFVSPCSMSLATPYYEADEQHAPTYTTRRVACSAARGVRPTRSDSRLSSYTLAGVDWRRVGDVGY